MSNTDKYRLGLDIGASSIKYGWGNCQQGLQLFCTRQLKHRSLSCLKDSVLEILREADETLGRQNIVSIGIGTPGTIDLDTGRIVGVNPNLPFWVGHDPRELIPPELDLPVFCDNDANLMCLAEAWLRGNKGFVVGITVGSGIGCGFAQKGAVYRGAHGLAMEFGHQISIPGGESCACGRKGCLEAYTSVDGIRRRISRLADPPMATTDTLALSAILEQKATFPAIQRIIDEGMDALALGLANLIVLLDPDVVVLGGGAMDAGLYDLDLLGGMTCSHLPAENGSRLRLEKALEGNRAGVLGAIILAAAKDGADTE